MQAQDEAEPKLRILYEYDKPGYLPFTLKCYEYRDLIELTFKDPNTRDSIWCMSSFCAAGISVPEPRTKVRLLALA
jgi:hypothetical protein